MFTWLQRRIQYLDKSNIARPKISCEKMEAPKPLPTTTQADIQGLLRFIVQCKVSASDALKAVEVLTRNGILSTEQLTEAGPDALDSLNEMVRKAVAKKLGTKRRRDTPAASSPSTNKRGRRTVVAAGSDSEGLPPIPSDNDLATISEDTLRQLEVATKRSPVMHVWGAAVALRLGYT